MLKICKSIYNGMCEPWCDAVEYQLFVEISALQCWTHCDCINRKYSIYLILHKLQVKDINIPLKVRLPGGRIPVQILCLLFSGFFWEISCTETYIKVLSNRFNFPPNKGPHGRYISLVIKKMVPQELNNQNTCPVSNVLASTERSCDCNQCIPK